ncbi:MAG: hypothetical protein KTR31_26390 [Myxococcales bacterium]|nr:hypothetical protein [Myxococcales bacterium]
METRSFQRTTRSPAEAWEITWDGGEVETWHQVGDDASTDRRTFRTAELAHSFVQEQIAERTAEGFSPAHEPGEQQRSEAELALWRHARANPEDDAAQLVLADWLVDHGDPLGDLILTGHQRDQGSRHVQLRRHVHDHLFVPWQGVKAHASWHRGFVRRLSLTYEATQDPEEAFVRLVRHLLPYPTMWLLTELRVHTRDRLPLATIVRALTASAPHPALRTLILSTSDPTETDLRVLWEALPNLERLELVNDDGGFSVVDTFPRFRTGPLPACLQALALDEAQLSDADEALAPLALTELYLHVTDELLADALTIVRSPAVAKLRRLCLCADGEHVMALLAGAPTWASTLEHIDPVPPRTADSPIVQQALPQLLAQGFPALKTVSKPGRLDWNPYLRHLGIRYVRSSMPRNLAEPDWPLDDEDARRIPRGRRTRIVHDPDDDEPYEDDEYGEEEDVYGWDEPQELWEIEVDDLRGGLSPDDPFDHEE